MKVSTIKSMLAAAKKNGHAEIVYNGMSSGGLYSSSSCRVPVFLTKYPVANKTFDDKAFRECLKPVGKKPEDFLDTVEVCDGFIKVTLNHLTYVQKSAYEATNILPDDLNCTDKKGYTYTYTRDYVARSTYSFTGYTEKFGERYHNILIPFENIVSIVC